MSDKNKVLKIHNSDSSEQIQAKEESLLKIILGQTRNEENKYVFATPEALYQHNCLILGVIGTGKTWTMARLIYESLRFNSKIITFDQNGEFANITKDTINISFDNVKTSLPNNLVATIETNRLNLSEILHLLKLDIGKERTLMLEICHKIYQSRKEKGQVSLFKNIDINQIINILDQLILKSSKTNNTAENLKNLIVTRIYYSDISELIDNPMKNSISNILNLFFNKNSKFKHLNIQLKSIPNKSSLKEVIINYLSREIDTFYSLDSKLKPCVIFIDNAENVLDDKLELKEFYSLIENASNSKVKVCFSLKSPIIIKENILNKIGCIISHRLKSEKEIEHLKNSSSLIDPQSEALIPHFLSGEALFLNASQFKPYLVKMAHNANSFQNLWG